ALSSPFTGRIVKRLGTSSLITFGMLSATVGYALQLTPLRSTTYVTGVLPTMLLVGAGFVFSFGALNMQATSGVQPQNQQRTVAMYQSSVQFSAALILSLTTALLAIFNNIHPSLSLNTSVSILGICIAVTGLWNKSKNITG